MNSQHRKKRVVEPIDPVVQPEKALSNLEVIAIAVFLLGGESQFVHTEDVAVKANEIAPGRFTWIKYAEQINIHTVMTHLWDAKSERKGSLLLGSEREGWMLTTTGLELARRRVHGLLGPRRQKKKISEAERRWMRTERTRMLDSTAYRKVVADEAASVSREEAEAFFRLNSYVVGKARERKILRVSNVFGDDPTLGPTVAFLKKLLRGG